MIVGARERTSWKVARGALGGQNAQPLFSLGFLRGKQAGTGMCGWGHVQGESRCCGFPYIIQQQTLINDTSYIRHDHSPQSCDTPVNHTYEASPYLVVAMRCASRPELDRKRYRIEAAETGLSTPTTSSFRQCVVPYIQCPCVFQPSSKSIHIVIGPFTINLNPCAFFKRISLVDKLSINVGARLHLDSGPADPGTLPQIILDNTLQLTIR